LYKENMGTIEALQSVATQARLNLKLFGFAGTKDKRAVTAQRCTAYRVAADKFRFIKPSLAEGGNAYNKGTVRVGDFDYVSAPLRLGELSGNEFQIVLRNVQGATAEELETLLSNIARRGFVNYYGMQRFGSTAVPSQAIGRALLRDDYVEAVALILIPRAGERDDIRAAREYYARTRHIEGTLARMPPFMRTEADILRALQSNGVRNVRSALETGVPRATRLMYVHAWQSFVWNHLVSARIELDPVNVREGDLVIDRQAAQVDEAQRAAAKAAAAAQANKETEAGDAAMSDVAAAGADGAAAAAAVPSPSDSPDAAPDAADAAAVLEGVSEEDAGMNEKTWTTADVHVVTSADVAAGIYQLSDVVLPLPGFDVVYPTNSVGELAKQMLEKDGITLTRWQKGKNKSGSTHKHTHFALCLSLC
jgi:tRNA pseudouridine13 synthase